MSASGELSASEIRELAKKYNLHSWSAQGRFEPGVVVKAEGIYYWDSDGKRYYDMSSQLVNLNIGYGNQKVIAAIKEQAEKLAYMGRVMRSMSVRNWPGK